jgi:hypothetical protein
MESAVEYRKIAPTTDIQGNNLKVMSKIRRSVADIRVGYISKSNSEI